MGRKILKMSKDFFRSMFSEGDQHYRVIADALPAGTTICKVSIDLFFDRDQIAFMLESPEWPDVPEGHAVPFIEPKLQSIPVPKSWRDDPLL